MVEREEKIVGAGVRVSGYEGRGVGLVGRGVGRGVGLVY